MTVTLLVFLLSKGCGFNSNLAPAKGLTISAMKETRHQGAAELQQKL